MRLLCPLALIAVCASFLTPPASHADQTDEIEHLLAYIEQSDCTFIRNGKAYPPEEARAHIQKKYDYVKRRIRTAEEFIRYAATKSSLSGRAYTVRCHGEEQLVADWLRTELGLLRKK